MRRRIKPIVVYLFLGFLAVCLLYSHHKMQKAYEQQLTDAKNSIPSVSKTSTTKTTKSTTDEDEFVLKPILDVSGWQRPSEIDYDTLSNNISGAIVRVYGGSQITSSNNAAYTTGVDKVFKEHITAFQKRNVPVAVYSYALGKSVKEMKAEARSFYKNASPYNPTFYWIDVEEKTMSNMNKGVKAFRDELRRLGAKNVGLYIGTYFMEEQGISTKGFDAVWIPTYGTDSGYYEAAPNTTLTYDLHQYTSQGVLPGFDNVLDLNQIAVTKDTKKTYEKLFGKVTSKN